MLLVFINGCASVHTSKAAKWVLLAGGAGMAAGAVAMTGGQMDLMFREDPYRCMAALGFTFLVFSAVAFCLDISIQEE